MAADSVGERGFRSRRRFLRDCSAGGSALFLTFLAGRATAADKLDWQQVVAAVSSHLATRRGYQAGDLITRGDVSPILDALEKAGWKLADRDKLLALVLEDGHFLARELRGTAGLKFARGVAREPLVFDRLDRLSAMPGGQQLIHDIIRLPNGQDFMASKPTPGFTDLTILLPKQANGKTPRDKDFSKPTGKIYTQAQLLAALEERWKNR